MPGYGIGPHLAAGAPALVPQTVGASPPVITETARDVNPPCNCATHHGADPELDNLRRMVGSGMSQWEASCRIWGPGALTIDRDISEWVREQFMVAFPDLDLTGMGAA